MPGNSWRVALGTWVSLRHSTWALGKWGRVIEVEANRSFKLETDACKELGAMREDFRVLQSRVCPHEWFPMRKTLPYGQYLCSDGSRVLYNRDYEPLIRISPEGEKSFCNPKERIKHEGQEWFYKSDTMRVAPWQSAEVLANCIRLLTE